MKLVGPQQSEQELLQNWGSLRIELARQVFELSPGFADGSIDVNFIRIVL